MTNPFTLPTYRPQSAIESQPYGAGEIRWYAANPRIHHRVITLPPGEMLRDTAQLRRVFPGDTMIHVMSATRMLITNPITGETHVISDGESALIPANTPYHVKNHGENTLIFLEVVGLAETPPVLPPILEHPKYGQDEWFGRYPLERAAMQPTIHTIRHDEALWRVEGEAQQILAGVKVATPLLTAGIGSLLANTTHQTASIHAGDECLYALEGTLTVNLPQHAAEYSLKPGDAFVIPAGTPHRYVNATDHPVRWIFAIAPGVYSTVSSHP